MGFRSLKLSNFSVFPFFFKLGLIFRGDLFSPAFLFFFSLE